MNTLTSPTPTRQRNHLIDGLRGLAIFGILMVNMPLMYGPMSNVLLNAPHGEGLAALTGTWLIRVFFEGKFYVLFSALFGYGFYLFLHKASGSPEANLRLFRRRLFFLLLLGAAHVHFLWAGDILVFYALFGFLLILFRNASTRALLRWAVVFAAVPVLLTLGIYGLIALISRIPEAGEAAAASFEEGSAQTLALFRAASEAYSSGTYTDTVRARWTEYLALLPGVLFFYPTVMAMFLAGFAAAREGVLSNFDRHKGFWRKAFKAGFFAGLPLALFYAYAMGQAPPGDQSSGWYAAATTVHIIGGIFLCLGYVAWMVRRYHAGNTHFTEACLAPVGRMALTNYISHSFITLWLFHGYGLGLFGKVGVWQGILLTVIIFVLQIFWSRWWLRRYRFGPLEWLWRSLTYGRRQPLKRDAA